MNKTTAYAFPVLALMLILSACGPGQDQPTGKPSGDSAPAEVTDAGLVTDARLVNANAEAGNWLSHGRTYDEQRFSPLDQVNDSNISELSLAWAQDLDDDRGVEATPVVVDGVLYTTGSWSIVYAFDAASGERLWKHDPKVPREWSRYGCCDVVNRGVAVWGDKVYVGTFDGYLLAIDAKTGEEVWRTLTIDRSRPYTITGAPRVVKGRVIIGNGGSELGVRGYVSAYDAETGEMDWRFYTVPGNPEQPFESPELERAAETWTGEWWHIGGGGTVWDSMAFDPELDLLYIGVGNGSPWTQTLRSPGGGDNLFLSSIVALRPDTGEYVWHYQTTPGDSWDYTATQHMILADLEIDGAVRKVLMQAPKNGFFYVLDRTSGELISAQNYVPVNWASHIDLATGRPVLIDDARYENGPRLTFPGPTGGHNWHPMSFSPLTGLVYIPAQELPFVFSTNHDFVYAPGFNNHGIDLSLVPAPEDPAVLEPLLKMLKGRILAWDPVQQKAAWAVEHEGPWNGGLLSTAGNLLFQSTPKGGFVAYRADTGERLWEFDLQTGAVAAPITYQAGGEQFVAIAAGWGTALSMVGGIAGEKLTRKGKNRMFAFKLEGDAKLPPPPAASVRELPPAPDVPLDESLVASGKEGYYSIGQCFVCHGDGAISGGMVPDLRYATPETHRIWNEIVLDGAYESLGMPGFGEKLTEQQATAIQMYVLSRAAAERQLRQRTPQ
jgi:PQQ-dependent dehydrogenase (methanol/ethanol family)